MLRETHLTLFLKAPPSFWTCSNTIAESPCRYQNGCVIPHWNTTARPRQWNYLSYHANQLRASASGLGSNIQGPRHMLIPILETAIAMSTFPCLHRFVAANTIRGNKVTYTPYSINIHMPCLNSGLGDMHWQLRVEPESSLQVIVQLHAKSNKRFVLHRNQSKQRDKT